MHATMISRNYISVKTIVVVATLIGVSLAFAAEASQPKQKDDQKVAVELYYESQCPGCREMITTSFKEAFETDGFLDMATVEFVPYGNAKETKTASGTYEFECQHGLSECIYNTIEVCALAKIKDPTKAFRYIDCIEHSDESRDPKQDYFKIAMACCLMTKLSKSTISQMEECATGLEGIELEHKAAVKTDALDPPHQFVPYVVVNGEHSDDVQDAISESLFDYVCGVYQGPNKSKACKEKTNMLRSPKYVYDSLVKFHLQDWR
jgi:interferon gamma-inducible protein 30